MGPNAIMCLRCNVVQIEGTQPVGSICLSGAAAGILAHARPIPRKSGIGVRKKSTGGPGDRNGLPGARFGGGRMRLVLRRALGGRAVGRRREPAERFVVDKRRLRRMVATYRAIGIALDLEHSHVVR